MQLPVPCSYVGCMNALNIVSHMLMGGVVLFAFVLTDLLNSTLTAHVYMTVIGLSVLGSQAILSVTPFKGSEKNLTYPEKSATYWIVQIIGSALAFIGACLGIAGYSDFYSIAGIIITVKHLQTAHGVMGFIVLLFTAVSLVGAIANLLLKEKLNRLMKTLYLVVSTLTILMAYIAISIKFGNVNANSLTSIGWAISFAVLTMISLLLMTGARVYATGRYDF